MSLPTGGTGGTPKPIKGGLSTGDAAGVPLRATGQNNKATDHGPDSTANQQEKVSSNKESSTASNNSSGAEKSKLGAAGTSIAGGSNQQDQSASGGIGENQKMMATAAALPAASAASQVMFAIMLLNWLKTLFYTALAAITNFINMIVGFVVAIAKVVIGGVLSAGAAISTFVGGAVSAATGAIAVASTGVLVLTMGVTAVVTGVGGNPAQKDGNLFNCSAEIVAAVNASGGDETPAPSLEKTTANAKKVFSVLSAWGMPDENVAGILGNWDAESGIDPTGVETIVGEPFTLGPRKKAAEEKGFDVNAVDPAYGSQFPGVKLLGIGLGQWSNDRNTQLLNYAKAGSSTSWSSLETQLGFMISKDSGAPVIKHMISTPIGSAPSAAIYFHDKWERSADTSTAKRETAATKWFAQMGAWEKNQDLANSILVQSGATVESANSNQVSDAKSRCLTDTKTLTSGLKQGGLTLKEAQALMTTYKAEGESVLVKAFGSGGPGDCGYGKADNCVGFSSYFMYKFTSFKQYAPGNGIDTAASIARLTDRKTSTTPSAYSVFSVTTDMPEGHTGVILGIQGDQAIIGEASCGSNHVGTRAYARPLSDLTKGSYVFTDVTDLITDKAMS